MLQLNLKTNKIDLSRALLSTLARFACMKQALTHASNDGQNSPMLKNSLPRAPAGTGLKLHVFINDLQGEA